MKFSKTAALFFGLSLLVVRPARAADEHLQLLDVSADVLAPGHTEIGLFWARYTRGIVPDLQLSTELAGDAIGFLNLSGRYRFLNRPELRASVDAGVYWLALLDILPSNGASKPLVMFVPIGLHGTIPLADNLELDVALAYRATITSGTGATLGVSSLDSNLSLVRYDQKGAWMAQFRFPLLSRADTKLDSLLGKSNVSGVITLDDVDSWGILLARDIATSGMTHFRLGAGYRHTPGILFYESLGHLLVSFDVYWR